MRIVVTAMMVMTIAVTAGAALAVEYDIVILNGRVMDPETNFDGVRNVGVVGNRIYNITKEKITGKRTIDAKGHVVAPGFINTHTHSFAPFDQKMVAHDGVTTIMDTESGSSSPRMFYEKYKGNSLLNYGVGVGHEEIRRVVMDGLRLKDTFDPTDILLSRGKAQQDGHASWALDMADKLEHVQIMTMFEQGMRDGAVAVTSTVGYMGYGVPTTEILELQKIAKKYNRFYGSHTRFGPTESLPLNYSLGVREIIANAVAIDGAVILSHIQNQNWQEIYELTRRLQEKGMTIFAEMYPATTGNPNIATPQLLPDKIKMNNIDPVKHIFNPDTGKLFKSAEEFFKMQKESPEKAIFLTVRDEKWMKQWPHMKNIAIANDSVAYRDKDGNLLPIDAHYSKYGGHPRNAGTSGIMLRETREQGIPLMDMVYNLSYVPAKYFSIVGLKAMQERGRMQEGKIADITIFNPDTVRETSSMKEGKRGSYTKGIPYVMVSGQLVIDKGVANTKVRPGQPIRYEPITEGKIKLSFDDKKYQWHADLSDERTRALTKGLPSKDLPKHGDRNDPAIEFTEGEFK
jgi:cytosine/adenosine deaminase-related metal-dependent hydrolase